MRNGHTTVVGAAGAIYVIGGYNGNIYFNDVWVSTDGGARPDSAVLRDTHGVRKGYSGVLRGYSEYSGSLGMLTGSIGGTGEYTRVAMGYSVYSQGSLGDTLGALRRVNTLFYRFISDTR